MDTKYKRSPEPDNHDLNQINTYAIKMNTNTAFLVYPSNAIKPFDFELGDVKIGSLVFDIGENLEQSGKNF